MERTLADLAALAQGEVSGDPEKRIRAVSSAAGGTPETISFAETEAALETAIASPVGAVIARRGATAPGKDLILADHPRLAFARIAKALHPESRPEPGVHETAAVDPTAVLGEDVHIAPQAVVEAGAEIGPRAVVGPGCVVGAGARVGADSLLHARVVLYPGVTLGERVRVQAGAVLGSDGFGYVDVPEGKEKFPQLGTLIVGDDVEIGANTTIDRAALDSTVIGDGTKIDNQVQIAHNVEIGRHCAISAQTGIAGTTWIGDRVVLGGQAGIADHVRIGSGTVMGAGSGLATGKVVPEGQLLWGAPAMPLHEAKKRYVAIGRVPALREAVMDLKKRVEALEVVAS